MKRYVITRNTEKHKIVVECSDMEMFNLIYDFLQKEKRRRKVAGREQICYSIKIADRE